MARSPLRFWAGEWDTWPISLSLSLLKPHSLVARIYGAKYFPNCRVTEATLRTNPSYIWRSIHGTLHLLRAVARWRIGC